MAKKDEVVKFEEVMKKTVNDNLGNDKKEEAFIEVVVSLFEVLVDIRDLLKKD